MDDTLQFAFMCPACGSVAIGSVGGNLPPSVCKVICQIATCKDCHTRYVVPGIFTGTRCVPPTAADLLTYWDKTTEDFATLWTFYHNKGVPGYETAYEDLLT